MLNELLILTILFFRHFWLISKANEFEYYVSFCQEKKLNDEMANNSMHSAGKKASIIFRRKTLQ